jgi:hypothetical protein
MSKHDTQPVASIRVGWASQRRLTLWPDRVERGKESHPLTGVRAEVAGAPMTGQTITVSGPEFAWTYRLDSVIGGNKGRRFAARLNTTAAQYEADRGGQ